jgi:hypothetical protein
MTEILRKPMQNMQPWYRGFTGTIKPSGEKGALEIQENTGRAVAGFPNLY